MAPAIGAPATFSSQAHCPLGLISRNRLSAICRADCSSLVMRAAGTSNSVDLGQRFAHLPALNDRQDALGCIDHPNVQLIGVIPGNNSVTGTLNRARTRNGVASEGEFNLDMDAVPVNGPGPWSSREQHQ